MGNRLSMDQINTVQSLAKIGHSQRQIAQETGLDRKTVRRYLQKADQKVKQAVGTLSACLPFEEIIKQAIQQGLSAQRIYQDLVELHQFPHSYSSVKRFVQKLKGKSQKIDGRIHTSIGHEAQVDFGQGAPVKTGQGKKRPHLFVMTLSYSRHAYYEVVWHQDVESFIRCHEHAFHFFGGIPQVIRLDNLKAGVLLAHLFEPTLNQIYQSYAHHAGFVPLPCRVRTPEHKGKVESGVDYGQSNALKGHLFDSLEAQNRHLKKWNKTIALPRRHGTTKRIVAELFEEEKEHLKAEPESPFSCFKIGKHRVHSDSYIEVGGAYYSIPHRLIGCDVVVHYNTIYVKAYFANELVAMHPKAQPGFFRKLNEHFPLNHSLSEEEFLERLFKKWEVTGSYSIEWAKKVHKDRQDEALRVLGGINYLIKHYSNQTINQACQQALAIGSIYYHTVKILCETKEEKNELLESHELIREMDYFANILKAKEANDEQ